MNTKIRILVTTLTSDRNAKQDFAAEDGRDALEKIAGMPIQRWSYTKRPWVKHYGPKAQDFHAAFGLGPDDKHIATVDADGVALAAIQGLNEKVEVRGQKSEVRSQKSEARNQRSEIRGQKSEVRNQRSEIRGQKSEFRSSKRRTRS